MACLNAAERWIGPIRRHWRQASTQDRAASNASKLGAGAGEPWADQAPRALRKLSDLRSNARHRPLLRAGPLAFEAERFGDVDALDPACTVEIGDGAGYFERAVVGAGRKRELRGRFLQKRGARRIGRGQRFKRIKIKRAVEALAAFCLRGACAGDTGGCFGCTFRRGRQREIGGGDGRHIKLDIDDQAKALKAALDNPPRSVASRSAPSARPAAAPAGIHRRRQKDARG